MLPWIWGVLGRGCLWDPFRSGTGMGPLFCDHVQMSAHTQHSVTLGLSPDVFEIDGVWEILLLTVGLGPFVGRYWETVQRLRINQFYGAPTAVRLLLKYGDTWVKKYDRSSLRTLGSGE